MTQIRDLGEPPTPEECSRRQRLQARIRPVALGRYRRPDWEASMEFYLHRCRRCRQLEVDYKHGWSEHFICSHTPPR